MVIWCKDTKKILSFFNHSKYFCSDMRNLVDYRYLCKLILGIME